MKKTLFFIIVLFISLVAPAQWVKLVPAFEPMVTEASEDNPFDATGWLVNADFSEGNISGWTCTFKSGDNATNVGYVNSNYTNGEVNISKFIDVWAANNTKFNSNYDEIGASAIGIGELSQTIENMPKGKYKFAVDCIAVQQYKNELNPVVGVELFATGGDIYISENIATGNGAPEHFEIIFVNTDSSITMGLRTTADCSASWIAADNFTLTYYGADSITDSTLDDGDTFTALTVEEVEMTFEVTNKEEKTVGVGSQGKCSISTSTTGSVSIPQTVQYGGIEYRVTSIGDYAFNSCTSLNSVAIPEYVTSIGDMAFSGCSSLTAVYITDLAAWCAISLGYYANPLYYGHHLYLDNNEIIDLVIPDGVTSIGEYNQEIKGMTNVEIVPVSA